jgi:hypothetical protein
VAYCLTGVSLKTFNTAKQPVQANGLMSQAVFDIASCISDSGNKIVRGGSLLPFIKDGETIDLLPHYYI